MTTLSAFSAVRPCFELSCLTVFNQENQKLLLFEVLTYTV